MLLGLQSITIASKEKQLLLSDYRCNYYSEKTAMNEEEFAQQVEAAISFGDPKKLKMLRNRAYKLNFKKQLRVLEEAIASKKFELRKSLRKKKNIHEWTSKAGKVYRLDSGVSALLEDERNQILIKSLTNEDIDEIMENKEGKTSKELIEKICKETGIIDDSVPKKINFIREAINHTEYLSAPEKVQINVRLSDENTSRINELCEYWKSKGELTFLEYRAKGLENTVFSSTTSFGRFILEAGINHLYMDLKNEKDIEEIVEFICGHYSEDPKLVKAAVVVRYIEHNRWSNICDDETTEEEVQKLNDVWNKEEENFNKMVNASIKPKAYEIFKNKNGEKIAQKLFNKFWVIALSRSLEKADKPDPKEVALNQEIHLRERILSKHYDTSKSESLF